MKYLVTFLILIMFTITCKQKNINNSNLNGFDISSDESTIIFSSKKDSLYNLYEKKLKSGKVNLIAKDSGNYTNPKYIDENFFVCIFYKEKTANPEFVFFDRNSKKKLKSIKLESGYISDFTFSKNNDKIYYIQAQTFDSYSPIAPKNFHDFDVYQINLNSLEIKQITNSNFYLLREIIDYDENKLLFSSMGESNESGLFFINKNDKNLTKIEIINDTLRKSSMYLNPVLWENNQIICSSSYQLKMLNLNNMKETEILPSNGYHYSEIRKAKNKIYYKLNDNSDEIFFFDLKDKKINSINLTPLR